MGAVSTIARGLGVPFAGRLIREGSLRLTFADGSSSLIGDTASGLAADLEIVDDRFLLRLLRDGEIGFGEAYMEGYWRSPDVVALLRLALANRRHFRGARALSWLSDWRARRRHEANLNTVEQARDNMHAHYDLSNDFYKLWLDERAMSYSCAVFANPEQSLEDAQANKHRILCAKAGLEATHEVLDIGGGWGGFYWRRT